MKFAVIGNPIDKSLSPQLHEILYERLNILNCSFEKIHLENDQLDDFFNNDFGLFNGINVTIPFKSSVVKFLDAIDNEAKILDNVNCISKSNNMICGFNTDKYGFDMLLNENGIVIEDKTNDEKNLSYEFKTNEIFKASDLMVDSLTQLISRKRDKNN